MKATDPFILKEPAARGRLEGRMAWVRGLQDASVAPVSGNPCVLRDAAFGGSSA